MSFISTILCFLFYVIVCLFNIDGFTSDFPNMIIKVKTKVNEIENKRIRLNHKDKSWLYKSLDKVILKKCNINNWNKERNTTVKTRNIKFIIEYD